MAHEITQHVNEGRSSIDRLAGNLSSRDGLERRRARNSLVRTGEPAVDTLIHLLSDDRRQIVRWEAASALGTIRDGRAAPALVHALEDEDGDVRWLAAEALISLRERALAPLFQALAHQAASVQLREGAHHVIKGMGRGWPAVVARPVLEALEQVDPELYVPRAARLALAVLGSPSDEELEP